MRHKKLFLVPVTITISFELEVEADTVEEAIGIAQHSKLPVVPLDNLPHSCCYDVDVCDNPFDVEIEEDLEEIME